MCVSCMYYNNIHMHICVYIYIYIYYTYIMRACGWWKTNGGRFGLKYVLIPKTYFPWDWIRDRVGSTLFHADPLE